MMAYFNLLASQMGNNIQVPAQLNEPEPVEVQASSTEQEDEMEEGDPKGKKAVDWDEDDEVRLCKAWCYNTENKKGINKGRIPFWRDCLKHYIKNGGDKSRTYHSLTSKWRKLLEQMSIYNGLFIQNTRIVESGLNEHDVEKQSNADYLKLKKRAFPHTKAWDVVKDYDKWQQIVLVNEGPLKRKKKTVYQTGSNDEGMMDTNEEEVEGEAMEIPNLNEDTTPTQSRRSKKGRTDSGSVGDFEKRFADYTISKSELLEKKKDQAERKKEKDELQIYDLKKKTKARDWKIFKEPHQHETNPRLKKMLIEQKTELAETYGWDKYWEED